MVSCVGVVGAAYSLPPAKELFLKSGTGTLMSVSWSGLCDLCSRICRRALVMFCALAFLSRCKKLSVKAVKRGRPRLIFQLQERRTTDGLTR